MKNGIAASKGYAIGKVFIQQHEEIVITDEKVTDVAAAKEELNKALEASKVQLEAIKAKTLEEIGKVFGVTRERIRQIEAKAIRKLRHPSRSKKLRDYLD